MPGYAFQNRCCSHNMDKRAEGRIQMGGVLRCLREVQFSPDRHDLNPLDSSRSLRCRDALREKLS